jgi:hypothetical protein
MNVLIINRQGKLLEDTSGALPKENNYGKYGKY